MDERQRVIGFQEKPQQPATLPGSSDLALASMGVYIFDTDVLVRALESDAVQQTTHDFGKDIIPALISRDPVYAYSFYDENKKSSKLTGGTSARSTRISKRTWISARSILNSICTIRSGRFAPTSPSRRPRNSCSPKRDRGAGRRWIR